MDTPAPATPPSTLTSVGTMLATKGLSVLAGIAVTHGLMTASNTETFISGGLLLLSLAWSSYIEYLRPIFLAQMEVLKAKSLAQAAALKAANVPKVTVSQIAAQSPTMGPAEVAKVIATLPPEIKETVWPYPSQGGQPAQAPPVAGLPKTTGLAIALAVATALRLGWPGAAHAQTAVDCGGPDHPCVFSGEFTAPDGVNKCISRDGSTLMCTLVGVMPRGNAWVTSAVTPKCDDGYEFVMRAGGQMACARDFISPK